MNIESWFKDWTSKHSEFPSNYMVIDTEATGPTEDDLLVQLGWCVVRNNKLEQMGEITIDWTNFANKKLLKKKLNYLNENHYCPITFDYTKEYGVNPRMGFSDFLDVLNDNKNVGGIFVGHNSVCFDFPLITKHILKYTKTYFQFKPKSVWDTGALEKGSQLLEPILPKELPGDFAFRILNRPNDGVKWSLLDHAVYKYKLVDKHNLDLTKGHTAQFDSYVNYLLFEEYRCITHRGISN